MIDFFSHCPVCMRRLSEPLEYCRQCGCHLLLLQKARACLEHPLGAPPKDSIEERSSEIERNESAVFSEPRKFTYRMKSMG